MSNEMSIDQQKRKIIEAYVESLVSTYSKNELVNYFIKEYYYGTYDLPEVIDIVLADKYTKNILDDYPNLLALSISSE